MEQQPSMSCVDNEVLVKPNQLPLSCPRSNQAAWNGHPRVYLSFGEKKQLTCYYCGTVYKLEDKR